MDTAIQDHKLARLAKILKDNQCRWQQEEREKIQAEIIMTAQLLTWENPRSYIKFKD